MRIDIITAFPEYFYSPLEVGLIRRALELELIKVELHNLRDFSGNKHGKIDDYPYRGGPGMILQAPPIIDSVKAIINNLKSSPEIILFSSSGIPLTTCLAKILAEKENLIILCGHYEGVDERVKELFNPLEISLGDYVISGGEAAALILIEAITRLIKGVLQEETLKEESFNENLLEYPQYTRPLECEGLVVPDVLRSGDHQKIKRWLLKESLKRTLVIRPDLIVNRSFNREEKEIIKEIISETILLGKELLSVD